MIYVYIHASMQYQTSKSPIIPSPHSPNTPGLNMQNGWLGIPYYQQFVGFPLH